MDLLTYKKYGRVYLRHLITFPIDGTPSLTLRSNHLITICKANLSNLFLDFSSFLLLISLFLLKSRKTRTFFWSWVCGNFTLFWGFRIFPFINFQRKSSYVAQKESEVNHKWANIIHMLPFFFFSFFAEFQWIMLEYWWARSKFNFPSQIDCFCYSRDDTPN